MLDRYTRDSFEEFIIESIREKKVDTAVSCTDDLTCEQRKRIKETICRAMKLRGLKRNQWNSEGDR